MRTLQSTFELQRLNRCLELTQDRAWISGVTGSLRNKPLLDMVGGVIEDYEYLWDEYYFSTATM